MTTYFKYTNSESFTLNGIDYSGFFNVQNGIAYTGKIKDDFSEELTPKNNFSSEFYLKQLEFDNQFNSIENIIPYFSNSFDILNKNALDKVFDKIDMNNLMVFKSLIISDPRIVDFDENDCHFYGLSSTNRDTRNDDIMTGKNVVTHIDNFNYSDEWGFLENVKYGDFIVESDQSFKYLCSTGENLITISGSFDNTSLLTYDIIDLEFGEKIYGIYYDEFENKINVIINGVINIYEGLNYIECGTLILVDSIKVFDVETVSLKWSAKKNFKETLGLFEDRFYNITSYNLDNLKFMKYGNNIRTIIDNNVLYFLNKKSSTLLATMNLLEYGIENVTAIDIRNVDDFVIVLHLKNGVYSIATFDPYLISTTFTNYEINDLSENKYDIVFSTYDSNIFYIRSSGNIETRFISNPRNTAGNFKKFSLKYPPDYLFNNTYHKFNDTPIKWNTNRINANNFYNIIFDEITRSNKNYTLLHNSGRLYALKQPIMSNRYTAIDYNTTKYFTNISCGDDSFGLYFNKNVLDILKDTLTLYAKASNSFNFKKDDVLLINVKKIDYDLKNLRINGNESINTTTMQRIFTLITEIQQKLISNLTTSE
jgi:hypothetical protein